MSTYGSESLRIELAVPTALLEDRWNAPAEAVAHELAKALMPTLVEQVLRWRLEHPWEEEA